MHQHQWGATHLPPFQSVALLLSDSFSPFSVSSPPFSPFQPLSQSVSIPFKAISHSFVFCYNSHCSRLVLYGVTVPVLMLFQEPWHARTLLPVVLSVLYVTCLVVLGLLLRSVSTFQMLRRELIELSGMPVPFYSEKCVRGELSRRAVFSAVYGQLENALTDAGDHHVAGALNNSFQLTNSGALTYSFQASFSKKLAGTAYFKLMKLGFSELLRNGTKGVTLACNKQFTRVLHSWKRLPVRRIQVAIQKSGAELIFRWPEQWASAECTEKEHTPRCIRMRARVGCS